MSIKIAIANQKGGIGKTTTALAVATGLKRKKKKVLMIDTDPQRNTTRVYKAEIEGNATLADIMYEETKAEECVQHSALGDIIASDPALKVADNRIPFGADAFFHLSDAMQNIDDNYDVIVLDTPPGSGIILGNVLTYVNYLIIPVICDTFGIQGLRDFYGMIKEFRKRFNPDLKILGLLKVKYKGRQNLTKSIEDNILPEFAKEMETIVFNTTIAESVKCQEAQAMFASIFDYAPNSTTAQDYSKFIKEMMKMIGGEL